MFLPFWQLKRDKGITLTTDIFLRWKCKTKKKISLFVDKCVLGKIQFFNPARRFSQPRTWRRRPILTLCEIFYCPPVWTNLRYKESLSRIFLKHCWPNGLCWQHMMQRVQISQAFGETHKKPPAHFLAPWRLSQRPMVLWGIFVENI